MSDSRRALVPIYQQQPVLSRFESEEEEALPSNRSSEHRHQQIPTFCFPNSELSIIFRCVTPRPITFCLSRRVAMDRHNFNSYNNNGQKVDGGFGSGSQGQGAYGFQQQQQFSQNQNQSGAPNGQSGGNSNFHHYHGSCFNLTFTNSGAYDLNIRIPGLTDRRPQDPTGGGQFNQFQPRQSIQPQQESGQGFWSNSQGRGCGVGSSTMQPAASVNPQPYQQFSDPYSNQQRNPAPIVLPGMEHYLNGHDVSNTGNELMLPRHPLRRSDSASTSLTDEFGEDCCGFGSQNSTHRRR